MTLEMVQGDHDISIHHSTADLCLLHIVTVNRNKNFVGTLDAVCDNHVASGGKGVITVFISGIQVVQTILAAANIKCVAVSQKHTTTLCFDLVHNNFRIVRTQISQITGFTKMDLDCSILVFKIDFLHTGSFNQTRQLLGQVFTRSCAEIGKINLRCHKKTSKLLLMQPIYLENAVMSTGEIIIDKTKTLRYNILALARVLEW